MHNWARPSLDSRLARLCPAPASTKYADDQEMCSLEPNLNVFFQQLKVAALLSDWHSDAASVTVAAVLADSEVLQSCLD